jgi:uncharacterized damage-inducible protein DinB
MTSSDLGRSFSLGWRALALNLDGVTEELALQSPAAGANTLNWLVGHVVAYRDVLLEAVGAKPVWTPAQRHPYSGEDDAAWRAETAVPLARMTADFVISHERLLTALELLDDGALDNAYGSRTLGEFIAFMHFHESYHVGQIGYARRLLGLPGMIKPPQARASRSAPSV